MGELFNGQLSFADIDAEKFLHVRRAHADRRVNAMDRLTDDANYACLTTTSKPARRFNKEGRIRALKRWFGFICFRSLSTCLIQRWSHIWRATWWPVASVACLARISSSQIRRYCASGISLSNRVGAKITRAHGKSGRRSRGLLF